jgi:hypothetical protein
MATYLECSIYLYTASLESPMTHYWATITCQTSGNFKKAIKERGCTQKTFFKIKL